MAYDTHANGSWFDETSLVAYYKLEDVNDSGPSGYTLTNVNTVTFVAGKFTNCANFVKASSQQLYVSNNLGIDGGNITMSLWINIPSQPANNTYFCAIQQASITSQVQYNWYYWNNGGTYTLYVDRLKASVAHQAITIVRTLATGTWLNYVYTYDGSNIRFYENGVLIGGPTTATGNGTAGLASFFDLGSYTIGGTDFFNGKMDECIIASRAWTAAEVARYYENSKGQFLGQAII